MKNRADVINLVECAQRGDKEGLNRLADAVKVRLYEYTVRMTLDASLAEDIVQESLWIMVQDIGTLRDSRQFWAWLMKIATNRIRDHHRRNGRRTALLSKCDPPSSDSVQDAVADVMSKEIRQIVLSAMHRLPMEHRLILNMRCYEEMSFTEIADTLGCRKFKARALFAKAKRTLGRNLAQSGLGKASLLGALVIYGKITATSEATGTAMSVTAASLKVGCWPALAAVATTRAALVAVAAVGVSVAATALAPNGSGTEDLFAASSSSLMSSGAAQGLHLGRQHWYYYPPESGGAVLIQIRTSEEGRRPEWRWFQNEEGTFSCVGGAVYRTNAHYYAPDLATMRLPTDSVALRTFLDDVESSGTPMEYVRPTRMGLLVVAGMNDEGPFTHVRTRYDITDEQAFQNPWQHDTKITDRRDALHKEGWAYLQISGQVGGRTVTGTGRIPFVLAKRHVMSPALRVVVDNSVILEDSPDSAVVCDSSGRIRHRFPGGTFLEGLPRPWEGLHTIDTIRRDAARRGLRFETQSVVEGRQASVTVVHRNMRLVYTIDLRQDAVREIGLYDRQREVGQLRLEYVKDLGTRSASLQERRSARRRRPRQRRSDTLWLFDLMQSEWD